MMKKQEEEIVVVVPFIWLSSFLPEKQAVIANVNLIFLTSYDSALPSYEFLPFSRNENTRHDKEMKIERQTEKVSSFTFFERLRRRRQT